MRDLRAIKRPIRLDPYVTAMVGTGGSQLCGEDDDEPDVDTPSPGAEKENASSAASEEKMDEPTMEELLGSISPRPSSRTYTKSAIRAQRLLADVLWSDPTETPSELGVQANHQRGLGMFRL